MRKWEIENRNLPRGRLDETRKLLRGPDRLSACSVAIPTGMDPSGAIGAAGALPGNSIRSLELWWNKEEARLKCVLVADENDIKSFRREFSRMYPGATFETMNRVIPEWFNRGFKHEICDVGTRHGHYATVFNREKAYMFMTDMASKIQDAKYAWVQIVFVRYDFAPFLSRHRTRLNERHDEIKRVAREQRGHPELNRDFMNHYGSLQKELDVKARGEHVVMSVRGLVRCDANTRLDVIGNLSTGGIRSKYDNLKIFRYKEYKKFNSGKKKSRIQTRDSWWWWRREYDQRICMFESRHLPNPRQFLGSALSEYFDKRWPRGYRTRRPLPFLILNPTEWPYFLHLPDPSTENVDITRGGHLPSRPSDKTGAGIGSFDAPRGNSGEPEDGSDEQPGWYGTY